MRRGWGKVHTLEAVEGLPAGLDVPLEDASANESGSSDDEDSTVVVDRPPEDDETGSTDPLRRENVDKVSTPPENVAPSKAIEAVVDRELPEDTAVSLDPSPGSKAGGFLVGVVFVNTVDKFVQGREG